MKFTKIQNLREVLNLSRWAIKYSRFAIAFWLAVSIAGLLAFSSLKYALFPDITFPVVIVQASAPSSTALDTEKELAQPLEAQLENLTSLADIRSSIYPGQAVLAVSFRVGTDLEQSTQKVKDSLAQIKLPVNSKLEISPLNLNESAVISYAIQSDVKTQPELIKETKDRIIPKIEQLEGILRVDLLGIGATNTGNKPDPKANLIHFNGKSALAFQVIKKGDANTLEVVKLVEKEVEQLSTELPQFKLSLASTQADYIQEATQATIDALLGAIALAVIVIFGFLRNWQATIITALAIPTSLLGTAIVMAIFGFNLETITLLALALVIGIVVDDAIVDVENIMRHLENGETPRQAAMIATREIGLTVTAATLTIVAVFLPVGFMEGTLGQFFKPFGVTVSAAVLISLLVARTLSPVLAMYWFRQKQVSGDNQVIVKDQSAQYPLALQYRKLLAWSLNHRRIVVGIAVISFISGLALIPLIPNGFIPKLDRGEFNISYTFPLGDMRGQGDKERGRQGEGETRGQGMTAQDMQLSMANFNPMAMLLTQSEKIASDLETKTLANPSVESVFTTIGVRGEPNRGKIYVKLKHERDFTTSEVQEQLRTDLPKIKNGNVSVEDIQFVELVESKPLQIALQGDNLEHLSQNAQEIKNKVAKLPGFVDVTTTSDRNKGKQINEIERLNGQRVAYINSNLGQGKALGEATDQVVAIAQSLISPDIKLDLGGDSARITEIMTSFGKTLGFSLICMLLLLLVIFGRLIEPIVIGLSLPLSIVGAMLALLLTQSDFGISSLIGLIFLLGLLDKNAILLIDYVSQLRQEGLSRTEAIIKTGQIRLRPILMTTFSTILGMLPLAMGWGAGAELRQPMAVAIIGGLVTSTLLSLIVVPVIYAIVDDIWLKIRK